MSTSTPDITAADTLRGRFEGAVNFLHNTTQQEKQKHSKRDLTTLPWHLVMGPVGSGKTTLLAQASVRYILAKRLKPENITLSENCDWWVTDDAVLIDIPGGWFRTQEKNAASEHAVNLWTAFLNLAAISPMREYPGSLILTLPLPELIHNQHPENARNLAKIIALLRRQIREVQQQFGTQLPIHFIITKCDLLAGFKEFFADSSREEMAQAWGIPLAVGDNLTQRFTERFNALIKRLNQQLIWRLHQARNLTARARIKDFPLEVEKIKDALIHLFNTLDLPQCTVSGVWLTSALQPVDAPTLIEQTIEGSTSLQKIANLPSVNLFTPPPTAMKSFFIRQVLHHAIAHPTQSAPEKPKPHARRVLITTAICLVSIAVSVLGWDFIKAQQNLQQLQQQLQNYAHTRQAPTALLSVLDKLQQAANVSTHARKPTLATRIVTYYSTEAQRKSAAFYLQGIQQLLLPTLSQLFEKTLTNTTNITAQSHYRALASRLMLAGDVPWQGDVIAASLQQIAPEIAQDKNMTTYLQVIAAHHMTDPLAPRTLTQAREALTNLPLDTRAQLLLLETKPFINKKNNIPAYFMGTEFANVLQTFIPAAATEALQGNIIIGKLTPTDTRDATKAALITRMRNQYLANYANYWENQLNQLALPQPTDLFATDLLISHLLDEKSQYILQLQRIHANTNFQGLAAVSPTLRELNEWFADPLTMQTQMAQNRATLQALHDALARVLAAPNPTKAAFDLAHYCLLHPERNDFTQVRRIAAKNPAPLSTWLHQVAQHSWSQVLVEANRYGSLKLDNAGT